VCVFDLLLSIQELSKALGVYCVNYSGVSGINIATVNTLISGAAQCGAWLCINNISAAPTDALIVLAERMSSIQRAVLAGAHRYAMMFC
jgi:dynein heavy chain, axonemal